MRVYHPTSDAVQNMLHPMSAISEPVSGDCETFADFPRHLRADQRTSSTDVNLAWQALTSLHSMTPVASLARTRREPRSPVLDRQAAAYLISRASKAAPPARAAQATLARAPAGFCTRSSVSPPVSRLQPTPVQRSRRSGSALRFTEAFATHDEDGNPKKTE